MHTGPPLESRTISTYAFAAITGKWKAKESAERGSERDDRGGNKPGPD